MATSGSSSYGIKQLQKGCYYEWMSIQSKHIVDLKEALISQQRSKQNDLKLKELVDQIVNDFQRYAKQRSELSHRSCTSYFAPSWNTSLENSLLWMGGCRPSSFIRVVYALCGSRAETHLSQYLDDHVHDGHDHDGHDDDGDKNDGFMSDLNSTQLAKINELHIKVIEREDKISKKAANLQEDVADMPIAVMAYGMDMVDHHDDDGDGDGDVVVVDDALDKHEECMAVLMEEADELRFETLKKIVEVVTPVQAAEFLLAGKRLHVSLHEWGRVREERRVGCLGAEEAAAAARGGARKSSRSATC